MTTAFLLTAALAVQQPDLRDAESVARLLASLRTADPAVCELAGRSLTNFGGWWNGDLPAPMPMPMPTPMPMPHAGGRHRHPPPRWAPEAARTWSPRCCRRFAAR